MVPYYRGDRRFLIKCEARIIAEFQFQYEVVT